MTTRIKLRRDTAANWLTANPILAAGEPGLETDTGKIKYGDGTTTWSNLAHAGGDTLNDEGGVVVTAGSTNYWQALQRRENQNTFGRGVRHDSEGNVYAVTQTSDGGPIAVITKYSSAGVVVWQHTIDEFRPYSLAVDSADCAYIAGENEDDGNTIDVWKFSTAGEVLWKKTYNGGAWVGECFIEERTSTRLALVANRDEGDYGVLVLDINSATGDLVTDKIINTQAGNVNIWAAGIDTDEDGNVVVTGRYYDTDTNRDKMFIEKLDTNLDRVWTKSVDTPNGNNMNAGDCASDAQGNVYAAAYYDVSVNNANNGNGIGTVGILIKLNSSGTVQWTRRLGPGPCGNGVVGLTATPTGDLYLATITITPSTNPQLTDSDKFAEGDVRMIVAKYDTAGEVLWQRYIDDDHGWEFGDNFRGQAISVYGDTFVTDYYGSSTNNRQINFSNSDDNEFEYFIVQLPADGTELEIGSMAFKASRIPGRFITQAATTSPLTFEVFGGGVNVADSTLAIDNRDRIANSLVKSDTYDYVFGPDGTLTIPNDGDLKLTQSQIGFFANIGGVNNTWSDIESHSVAVDSDGFMYVGGEEYNTYTPFVAKISPEGQREWCVRIYEDGNDWDGGVKNLAIDPATGNLLVTCHFWPNYEYAAIITLDPDTGRILSNSQYIDQGADVELNELTFLNTGDWIAAGSKNGNFSPEQTVSAETGSALQKLVVLRSNVTGNPDNQWQIGGTGFSVFENINAVEQYSNLTTTVREGSGAVFNLTIADATSILTLSTSDLATNTGGGATVGADSITTVGFDYVNFNNNSWCTTLQSAGTALGPYRQVPVTWAAGSTRSTGFVLVQFYGGDAFGFTPVLEGGGSPDSGTWKFPMSFVTPAGITVTVTNGGSNYLAGHKIKILGSVFPGGVDVTNDVIVYVTGTSGGVITDAVATQATILAGTFTDASGTNYQVGSGLAFTFVNGPTTSNQYSDIPNYSISNYGSGYAVGDVIKVLGTDLGGTTPTNDLIITVTSTGGSGEAFGFSFSGTAQSTTWSIFTSSQVDFSQPGSWQLTYPLSRENLLLTANWQRTYGTNTGAYTDETLAMAIDSGGNIVTVTTGYGEIPAQGNFNLAVVYKFNSSGTLQWARRLNDTNADCYGKSVTTIGTDIYATHGNTDGQTIITKINAAGTVQWQRRTQNNGGEHSVIESAGDGTVLVMTQDLQQDISDDMMKIFKITADGEIVYKRWFSAVTNNDTRLNIGRTMRVRDGYMYISGYYDTNNSQSTWMAKLPADGSGTGDYGQYRYTDVNNETGSYIYMGLTNMEYTVDEITSSYFGELAVAPYVNTTDMGLDSTGAYAINSFYEPYTVQSVRDTGGGCIIFPDGTTQDTSAQDVPQNIYRGESYTLSLRDRGHHIYCIEAGNDIRIPYYARVPFPVGTQILFVNNSGNTVYISTEGQSLEVKLSGDGGIYTRFSIQGGDVATLLNVGRDRWFFYGDVNWD